MTGLRFIGQIGEADEAGALVVVGEKDSTTLALESIVQIDPLDVEFWTRVKGSFDVGFSFAKADEDLNFTLGEGF